MLSRLGLLRALPDAPALEHDARPDPLLSGRGDDPPRSGEEDSNFGGEGGKDDPPRCGEGDVPRAGARAPPSSSAPKEKEARPERAGTSAAAEGAAARGRPPAAASREVARSSSASWHSRRGSAGGSCCGPVCRSQRVRWTFSSGLRAASAACFASSSACCAAEVASCACSETASMTSLAGWRTATSAITSRVRPSVAAVTASARSSRPERAWLGVGVGVGVGYHHHHH